MSRQVGRVNQQSKGETPLMSGVLQGAAVRAVADKEVEATEEVELGRLRESRFRQDFSKIPIGGGGLPKEVSRNPNKTGLPDHLKAGVENLSGYSLDDVRVHYNSPKPAQLQAFAYTQGTEIHVAPGQDKHLPHEAWHVVQQMQGRVKPTMQMKGVQINDDEGLEKKADVMGEKALQRENTKLIQKEVTTQATTEQQGESETSIKSVISHRSPSLSLMIQRKIMLGDRLLENDSEKLGIIHHLITNPAPRDKLLELYPNFNNNEFFKNIIDLSPNLQREIIEVCKNKDKDSIDLSKITYTGNLVADEAINVLLSTQAFKRLSEQLQEKLGKFYQSHSIEETDVPSSKEGKDKIEVIYADQRTEVYSRKLLETILIDWYNVSETIHFSSIDEMFTVLIQQMNAEQIKQVPKVNVAYNSINWRNEIDYAKYSLIEELDELVESLGSDQNADDLISDSITFTKTEETVKKLEEIKIKLLNKDLLALYQEYQNNQKDFSTIISLSSEAINQSKTLKIQEKEQEAIKVKISAIKLLQGVVDNLEMILEQMSLIFGLQGGANIFKTDPWKTAEIISKIVKNDLLRDLLVIVQSATAQEAGRDSKQEDRYPVATGTLYYANVAPPLLPHKNVMGVLVEPDVIQKIKFMYRNIVKNLSGNERNDYTLSYQGQIDIRKYIYIRHGVPVDSTTINTVYEKIQDPNLTPTAENLKELQKLLGITGQGLQKAEKLLFLTEDIKPASKTAAYTVGTATTIPAMYDHLKDKFPKVSPQTPQPKTFESAAKRRDRGKGQFSAMGNTNAAGYAWVLATIREQKGTAEKDLISGKPFLESQKEVTRTGWEWLHIRSAGLGGATDATNLVVGTHAANSHMIPFEHQVKELASLATQEKPLLVLWEAQNIAPGYAQTISIKWAAPNGLYNPDKEIFLPPVNWEDNMKAVFNPVNGLVFDKMQRDLDWQSLIIVKQEAKKAIIYLAEQGDRVDISKLKTEEQQAIETALSAVNHMTQEQIINTIQILCKKERTEAEPSAIWLQEKAKAK